MRPADARAFSRPTFNASEKRPGDEVETDPSFENSSYSGTSPLGDLYSTDTSQKRTTTVFC